MSLFSDHAIPLSPTARFLLPAECGLLAINFSIGLGAVLVIVGMDRNVEWAPFLIGFLATFALVGIGGYIRARKDSPRLALGLIGFAIYMSFIVVSGLFIFALLPLPHPLYDERLMAIDATLGYNWRDFVVWLADFPLISLSLAYLYGNALLQLLLLIVALAWYSRPTTLHRFLLTGMVTLMVTVSIWWFLPTVGPSAFQDVPEPIVKATNLLFHPGYGPAQGTCRKRPSRDYR
jgi:hypothetical protein